MKTNLLKKEKNENQHIISCLSGNPAECKSLLNIIPLDSRVKPENDREVGRSMVEMLGVLAVMGVLSIAGIAGYNNAMNKHRANELLNEASKRAVIVAGQFLNHDTASLTEFTGHNQVAGATFTDTTATKDANNQFTLTITGVSEAVCNHMQNMKTALIQKFDASCETSSVIKLTYNADLSMGSSSGTGNESGTTTPACDPACTGGKECVNGTCECPDDKPIWNVSEQKCEENVKDQCGNEEFYWGETDSYYVEALNICQPELWCMDAHANIDSDTYTCLCPKYAQKLGAGTAIAFECVNRCSYGEPEKGACPCRVYDTDGGCTPCTGGQQGYNIYGNFCQCATGFHFDYDDAKDCVPDE